MEQSKKTAWIKLDSEKLTSVESLNSKGVKSFLTPANIPSAVRIFTVDDCVRFEYRYELDLTKTESLESFEGSTLNISMKIQIGSKSKRLYSVDVPQSKMEALRQEAYKKIRRDLEGVRMEHPRWGTFSAVSNVFAQYSSVFDSKVQAYA